jgi:hypothetical protein
MYQYIFSVLIDTHGGCVSYLHENIFDVLIDTHYVCQLIPEINEHQTPPQILRKGGYDVLMDTHTPLYFPSNARAPPDPPSPAIVSPLGETIAAAQISLPNTPKTEGNGAEEGEQPAPTTSDGCVCALSETRQAYIDEVDVFCPHHKKLMRLIEASVNRKIASLPMFQRGRKTREFWVEMTEHCMDVIEERGWLSPKTIKLHPVLGQHFSNPHQYARLRAALLKIKPDTIVVFKLKVAFSPYYVTTKDRITDTQKQLSQHIRDRDAGGFP